MAGFRSRIGGQNEGREEFAVATQLADHLQKGDPVDVGHVEVEQDDVGLLLDEDLPELARVGDGTHFGETVSLEDRLDERDVRGLVVYDEHLSSTKQALFEVQNAAPPSDSTRTAETASPGSTVAANLPAVGALACLATAEVATALTSTTDRIGTARATLDRERCTRH